MFTTMLEFLQEAAKVLHLDASHSALRQKLQGHVDTEHRKTLADSGSDTGYYDTPYVQDVYGTEDSGQVVTSHKGQMHVQKFSKGKDGAYKLGDKKKVKQAYVADNDADDKKESLTLVLDGRTLEVQETATTFTEVGDVVELQEAAKNTRAKITLITAGKGSSGYYTEAALQKAAKDKVFAAGTQMFLNHPTAQEAATRPEGDITKLAATTKTDAVYVAGENGQPGRLVAESTVYPEFAPFIAARKDDIGVSVRVGATTNGTKDGVPLVENMVFARSVDFVTKAGRGGKIEEMYESYRAANPPVIEAQESGNQPQENNMTDQEKLDFAALRTAVSRLQESNARLSAQNVISNALATSGLKPRGQERVRQQALAVLPMSEAGVLDEAKLQESVKALITDEIAYLQESGVSPAQVAPVVRNQGVVADHKEDGTELSESEVAENAEKVLTESLKVLGRRN